MKLCMYILLLSALIITCTGSRDQTAIGPGSETVGVTGRAVMPDGTPVAHASVVLRSSDYLATPPVLGKQALHAVDAYTDDSGRFAIAGIDPGSYSIEIRDTASQMITLLPCSLDTGDAVNFGIDTLRPYATVTGSVDLVGSPSIRRYVQVYGMERLVDVGSNGAFTIDNLPAGLLRLRIMTPDTSVAPLTIDSVRTTPGSITEVPMAGWRFSKRLYLNTTASGANVSEDVANFPLLVRLDSLSLDFAQARDSGQDLRFIDSKGTPLPYEIEQWDRSSEPQRSRATVWVKMDTVRGNNATQYILMHWGNPLAKSISNGAAVFDTTVGYLNVFHLGNDAQDAIAHRSSGIVGNTRDSSGAIAAGTYFNGIDDSIGFASTTGDTIVFSAWVYARTRGSSFFPNILQNPAFGVHFGFQDSSSNNRSVTFWTDSGVGNWKTLPGTIDTGAWYFVTVMYDATSFGNDPVIYLNGAPCNLIENMTPISTGTAGTGRGYIGNTIVNAPWDGCIDELRISRKIVTTSWIRLSWENQRPGQRLVHP